MSEKVKLNKAITVEVEGSFGTWYPYEEATYERYGKLFFCRKEREGEGVTGIIVNSEGNVLFDKTKDGFSGFNEYIGILILGLEGSGKYKVTDSIFAKKCGIVFACEKFDDEEWKNTNMRVFTVVDSLGNSVSEADYTESCTYAFVDEYYGELRFKRKVK